MRHISLSMLPDPPIAPPDPAMQRLRHRLTASEDARRRVERENLALRQQIQTLLRRLAKRGEPPVYAVNSGTGSARSNQDLDDMPAQKG
jgi:hypothetical protein